MDLKIRALLIGMDPETEETVLLCLRLRWPDARPIITTNAQTGLALLEQESPDMLVLQSNSSNSSLSRTIKEVRLLPAVAQVQDMEQRIGRYCILEQVAAGAREEGVGQSPDRSFDSESSCVTTTSPFDRLTVQRKASKCCLLPPRVRENSRGFFVKGDPQTRIGPGASLRPR